MNFSKSSSVKLHPAQHYTGDFSSVNKFVLKVTGYNTGMRMLKIAAGFLAHKLRALRHPKAHTLGEKELAPDFELPDESGQKHSLKNYRGKKVVLWFFLRADTPG